MIERNTSHAHRLMNRVGEKRRELVEFLGSSSAEPLEVRLRESTEINGGVNAPLGFLLNIRRHTNNRPTSKKGRPLLLSNHTTNTPSRLRDNGRPSSWRIWVTKVSSTTLETSVQLYVYFKDFTLEAIFPRT